MPIDIPYTFSEPTSAVLLFDAPFGGNAVAQIVFAQHTLVPTPTPEPGAGLLLATGLLGLALARRATSRR